VVASANEVAQGEQRTPKGTVSHYKRDQIVQLFGLGEQSLAEFDCAIVASPHPIVPPHPEDRLYLFVRFAELGAQGASTLERLQLCSSNYPIGCIGYSYCFEATAALKRKPEVDALAALCPIGVDATRFLRTHSGLGSEVDHVEDMIDFIASLPASDRTAIVQATYRTAATMAKGLREDRGLSDSQILAELQTAAGQEIHSNDTRALRCFRADPSALPRCARLHLRCPSDGR
jgi:hypothetical protein